MLRGIVPRGIVPRGDVCGGLELAEPARAKKVIEGRTTRKPPGEETRTRYARSIAPRQFIYILVKGFGLGLFVLGAMRITALLTQDLGDWPRVSSPEER